MRYSFLDLLADPVDGTSLSLCAEKVIDNPIPEPYCPAPEDGQVARNLQKEITSGFLVSETGRWYPIIDGIPEVLPDQLRDWDRDLDILKNADVPPYFRAHFESVARNANRSPQAGDNYKAAEISLLDKVDDRASFTGPGLLSPFNPYAFHHSSELIRGFGCCIPFMKLDHRATVLDSGSGYCWTTEWFMKMGVRAVGVEINREYVQVGLRRMGVNQPEIIIADAENLPFKASVFDAVLGFDAFHHIPNRERGMEEFSRVLRCGGGVTLVEPGEAHEADPVSQAVMEKYGNLERGMSLQDVADYVRELPYSQPEEHFLMSVSPGLVVDTPSRDFIGWSLFTTQRQPRVGSGAPG